MLELRLRNKVSEEEMALKTGKMLLPSDINVLITGPTRVLKPDGQPLCVFIPDAIPQELKELAYPILHRLRNSYTSNRGLASGSKRAAGASTRSYARSVDSAILGAFDKAGPIKYCRLTAWTGKEMESWEQLRPYFEKIAELFKEYVPDRFANQAREAARTDPEWVIPGTPFTTITVNNTYPTGVHKDAGDLDAGFSTITCLRRGEYKGGTLCFPEYRVGADLHDGDLILMDAHEWHGNIEFDPKPERDLSGKLLRDPGFERISVVSYFRTKMIACGSAADEQERQRILEEEKAAALVGE